MTCHVIYCCVPGYFQTSWPRATMDHPSLCFWELPGPGGALACSLSCSCAQRCLGLELEPDKAQISWRFECLLPHSGQSRLVGGDRPRGGTAFLASPCSTPSLDTMVAESREGLSLHENPMRPRQRLQGFSSPRLESHTAISITFCCLRWVSLDLLWEGTTQGVHAGRRRAPGLASDTSYPTRSMKSGEPTGQWEALLLGGPWRLAGRVLGLAGTEACFPHGAPGLGAPYGGSPGEACLASHSQQKQWASGWPGLLL